MTAETVVLRGGLSVPLPALQLLWSLEERGFAVTLHGATLSIRPMEDLTGDDHVALRTYRAEVCRVIRYCERLLADDRLPFLGHEA